MKKKAISIFLAFIMATSFVVSPAQAHHYIYSAENPVLQDPDSPYTDNRVLAWWWWGLDVNWWADPSAAGGQFIQEVRTAITKWDNAILPYTEWKEVTDPNLADIKFIYSPGPCPDAGGCMEPIAPWENRSVEKASYMKRIDIYINSLLTWLVPEGRTGAIAHEIGHVYGLTEQYLHDVTPPCNPDVRSIMDGGKTDAGKEVHCDGLQEPTSLDVQRVKAYWGGWESGTPENLKRSEPISNAIGINSWIITTWVDFAWAEQVHQMDWYWSSSSGGPFNNWYRGESIIEYIGTHFYTEPRTIRRDVNRTDYSPPADSWNIMCGRTWSVPFQRWGNIRCSNAVQLN